MDIGKIKASENIFSNPVREPYKQETFNEQNSNQQNKKKKKHALLKNNNNNSRLNDYDLNILETYAYKELPDETLKMEYSISMLEQKINVLNTEISTLEGLDSNVHLSDLKFKRDILEAELSKLREKYKKTSIWANISSNISEFLKSCGKVNLIIIVKEIILRLLLSKISRRFKYRVMVKDAIGSLNNINEHVDELIKMQSPYGETEEKYKKITAFLNKANYLHAKIIAGKKNKTNQQKTLL
jgi:hypothetical protein